jgi:hypothetical protein
VATYYFVPDELADELVAFGAAVRRPRPRGQIIDLIVVGSTTAATCITLLQTPDVYLNYARALKSLRGKKNQSGLEVRVKGPKGEIHLVDCTEDTPLEELAALLKRGLLG